MVNQLNILINRIRIDQQGRAKVEDPLGFNILNDSNNPDKSTTGVDGHFIHSLLLIDVLIRMRTIEKDKKELIKYCKNIYKGNNTELDLIHEFKHEYTSAKATWWYSRESFVYRLLNKALRVQNIDSLFLFRFVITDIYQQLKQNQCQTPVRVYRGQVMSNDELNSLKGSIGKLISINSFFSTSKSRHNAMNFFYASSVSNDLCGVLYNIDADPHVAKSKPFADISSVSDVGKEKEILFMAGCVFRLNDIQYDKKKQVWNIHMNLCGDGDHDLNNLFNYLKNEYGCGGNEANLQSLGNVLYRMGKYDLAEKMYNRLLGELPPNDPSLSYLYQSLAMISKDRKQYDKSIELFQKSLEIKTRTDPNNFLHMAILNCCMGDVYEEAGSHSVAMECYKAAIDFSKIINAENSSHMAAVYHGIANIYNNHHNYSEALKYYKQSLDIQRKYLPATHADIATNHDRIGIVHQHLGQYDIAMNYLLNSLEIREKSRPPQHPDIARSHQKIGLLSAARNEQRQALMHLQKASTIFHHSLSPQHPDVIGIDNDIRRVSSQTN